MSHANHEPFRVFRPVELVITPAVATQLTFADSKPGFNSNCEGGGGVGVGVGVGVTVGVGVGVGVGDPPHPANLNEPMRVRQLLLPFEGMYSVVYQKVQSSTGSIVRSL